MDTTKSTITLTFGDSAENHVGMEQLGIRGAPGSGFTIDDLTAAKNKCEAAGATCELHQLAIAGSEQAAVLVIRNGVNLLLGADDGAAKLFAEQAALNVDRHAFMYGRVVNKHARWNLCFDDFDQEPSYAEGKGRVIAFNKTPLTNQLHGKLEEFFGSKAAGLKGEGNYYYDINKCGIGFHGDSERRKVIGVRLGAAMPMHWQWFHRKEPVGDRIIIPLNGGDIYLMSEKAVGTDWKMSSIHTLRHATGCAKFTTI